MVAIDLRGPFIRQCVLPAMELFKQNRIREKLNELRQTERHSFEQLHALQIYKLKQLLIHSVQHVPVYNKFASLLPMIEENPLEALTNLPILTKSLFRMHRDEFLADTASIDSLLLNRSGGSTGEPVTFYMDRHTVEYSEAARWRGLSWWNIHFGDPCAMFWGSPIELSKNQLKRHRMYERWLKNRIIIPAFDLHEKKVDLYIRQLESFQPAYLYVWPSTLELFIHLLKKRNQQIRHLKLKAIVSTAETLHPHQRELFSTYFSCPVVNEYGAREGGILAYECPNHQMHVTIENALLEIVDPVTLQPLANHETGRLLVTDLNNFVMPRLRYQLGDWVALSWEACSCGRNLPIIKNLEGREDDTFITTDGKYVNGQYFTNIARTMTSIHKFQIIQVSRNQIQLILEQHEQLLQTELEEFKKAILKTMGAVEVNISLVDEIPVAPSGKFRVAKRECSLT